MSKEMVFLRGKRLALRIMPAGRQFFLLAGRQSSHTVKMERGKQHPADTPIIEALPGIRRRSGGNGGGGRRHIASNGGQRQDNEGNQV